MSNDINDRLAALAGQFKEAPVGGGFDNQLPEDGDYQGVVDSFDTFESKQGELFLKTIVKVANDPKYNGLRVEFVHSLENPDKFAYLKKHLASLGLDVAVMDFATLMSDLNKALDVPVEFVVKTSTKINEKTGEPYRNAYVNRPLGAPLVRKDVERTGGSDLTPKEALSPAMQAGTEQTDSIPF